MTRGVLFTCSLLIICCLGLSAQTNPDAADPAPVCDNSFTQNTIASGGGLTDDLTNCSICLDNGENNSSWYQFTVQIGGTLAFDITPLGAVDYDFTLFDITGLSPLEVINCTGLAPEVRCNYAFGQGVTGLRPGFANVVSGPAGDQFLAPVNVTVGQTFLLLVDNFTTGNTGYSVDFTGTADFADQTGANILSIGSGINPTGAGTEPFSCTAQDFFIMQFNEPISCADVLTITPSDITVTGPAPVAVTSVTGLLCDSVTLTQFANIGLASPLTVGGNYTITIPPGTFLDQCQNPNPAINFNFTIPNLVSAALDFTINATCSDDIYNFENISLGTGFSQVDWDFGDGTTSNLNDPIHTFPSTGPFTVELTVTGSAPEFCQDVATLDIVVGSSFSADFTFAPTTICPDEIIQFTNTSTGIGDYFWEFSDGGISIQENPTYSFSTPGPYTATFSVIDNNVVPACTTSITKDITVLPNINVQAVVDLAILCSGQPANFSNTTIAGSPATLEWDFGDGTGIASGEQVSYIYPQGGIFDAVLTVTDSFCGMTTDTLALTVIQEPNVELGDDTSLCLGDSIRLTLPADGDSYVWSTGNTTPSISFTDVPATIVGSIILQTCTFSDSILIDEQTENCFDVFVPTAFSPNGDGINDLLRTNQVKIKEGTIQIFNRWGQMLYEGDILNDRGWDGTYEGTKQELGTYTYLVTATPLAPKPTFFKSGVIVLVN